MNKRGDYVFLLLKSTRNSTQRLEFPAPNTSVSGNLSKISSKKIIVLPAPFQYSFSSIPHILSGVTTKGDSFSYQKKREQLLRPVERIPTLQVLFSLHWPGFFCL